MRLVFVHGMRQEGKDPVALRQEWEDALNAAWAKAGLAKPNYTLEMPFYGDVLNDLTEAIRGPTDAVVKRGEGGPSLFTPDEEALILEMKRRENISDAEVNAELGQEVVARGPANWEWVQAIGRVLERRVPGLGGYGIGFVHQVDAYLSRGHIRAAVDQIVKPALLAGPAVVVAHSLGTIVSYLLLRKAAAQVPLYVTLGSPLGIPTVKKYLRPPQISVPQGVAKWLNGTDERDYVALYSRLDRDNFADGIENLSDLHNRKEDAHYIGDYLADTSVSRRIHEALR